MDDQPSRLKRYEDRSATPLVMLALLFFVLYATPVVWLSAPAWLVAPMEIANGILWVVFAADLAVRAWLSEKPAHYLKTHPIDLALVVLPMFRPLRVLRVFTALQVLVRQGARISIGETLAGTAAATALIMLIAAVAMLDAERGEPGAVIETFGDAMWWSGVTVTTVGYGDLYPVTALGRMVGFALMLVGVSMLGILTASIAAWFVGREREVESDLTAEIRALRAEVQQMRTELPRE